MTLPRSVAREVGLVLAVHAVLGLAAAVVWWLLVDPALFTKEPGGGLSMGEVELGRRFAADGWFAVVTGLLGLVTGVGLLWRGPRHVLAVTLTLPVGALLGSGLAALVGRGLGPADPEVAARGLMVGARVPAALEVTTPAVYLVWPITALVGALVVLWSPPAGEYPAP